VAEAIARRMPAGTVLLDTGEAVARQTERLLSPPACSVAAMAT
jgi:glutamate racemase